MIVTTTKGEMDDSLLEKKEGSVDNDNDCLLYTSPSPRDS